MTDSAVAKAGADPNFRGPAYDCSTLLHVACAGGWLDCARLLLEKGAGADLQNLSGVTALSMVKRRGPELSHMHELLHDQIESERFRAADEEEKLDTLERAKHDETLLKYW
jgi:ankyrin repeat protein